MRLKVLSLFAAVVLVAACAQPQQEAAVETTVAVSAIEPGSQEDFVVNVGDRVFFAFDRSDLSAEARATLERQAAWLQQYPNRRIVVEGHADERGTREYNLGLGERRANSVRQYLVALGIDAGRLTTVSYGKERPAVLGSNEAAWAQNRRGVSVVQ